MPSSPLAPALPRWGAAWPDLCCVMREAGADRKMRRQGLGHPPYRQGIYPLNQGAQKRRACARIWRWGRNGPGRRASTGSGARPGTKRKADSALRGAADSALRGAGVGASAGRGKKPQVVVVDEAEEDDDDEVEVMEHCVRMCPVM